MTHILEKPLELSIPDAKCSDWIATQPLDRFCKGTIRNDDGQMCGVGLIADFLGFSWDTRDKFEAYLMAGSYLKEFLPLERFDAMFNSKGPGAAREYTVQFLQEQGL